MSRVAKMSRLSTCWLACVLIPVAHAQRAAPGHKLLDVLRVSASGDAASALVVPLKGPVQEVRCDIVIIGAGLGGVSAALSAAATHQVCMTEPTLWVGGQATSEGVSAFDDNKFIDTTGGTASYLDLSRRIRAHYAAFRRDQTLTLEQAIKGPLSNPGGCWVSRLCFEPAPAQQILTSLLEPLLSAGRLRLWLHTVPVSVERKGRTIDSVLVYDFARAHWVRLRGRYFVDASELGDLLALSGLPYRMGAEAQSETHERNAPQVPDRRASQSFTYPFILQAGAPAPGAGEAKPPEYDTFLPQYTMKVDYGHGKFLTYGFFQARPGLPGSFWEYRRSVDAALFQAGAFPGDRSMINWSSNDHCDSNLLSADPLLQAHALQDAKRLSLGFAWWIRNSVPRDDGRGLGYPELTLLQQAMGSQDGLSQQPYIRESRRVIPLRTVVEEDLAVDFQPGSRAALYPDSVGIGWYPIDIHSCDRQDFVSQTKPYEIPLGALIARDADNLLAVGKAMGTTHITNGAYRLHPTEWASGEAAGVALAWALDHATTPAKIDRNPAAMEQLQLALVRKGHPIFWYDDIPVASPDFAGMQMAGARQWWTASATSLHAGEQLAVQGSQAVQILESSLSRSQQQAIRSAADLRWSNLKAVGLATGELSGTVRRGQFAAWMVKRLQSVPSH